jgi:hypothetical protein
LHQARKRPYEQQREGRREDAGYIQFELADMKL